MKTLPRIAFALAMTSLAISCSNEGSAEPEPAAAVKPVAPAPPVEEKAPEVFEDDASEKLASKEGSEKKEWTKQEWAEEKEKWVDTEKGKEWDPKDHSIEQLKGWLEDVGEYEAQLDEKGLADDAPERIGVAEKRAQLEAAIADRAP